MAGGIPIPRFGRRGAALLVVGLAVVAYLPSLGGEFVSDDHRFIVRNESVHRLTPAQVYRYFSDPRSQAILGYDIYRPLRTLDFAIDWAIAGPSPLFFRLRNLLYHVLGSVLVLALFRRLLGDRRDRAAFVGALLFALHPVHTESVAFVSSRGDLLMLVLTVGGLLLHLGGRYVAAALTLVLALLSKEAAVVFPALALLVDLTAGRRPALRACAVYGVLAVAFTGLWFGLVAGLDPGHMGQQPLWLGGSWFANLVTVGKGFLYDAKVLVLPVDLVFDWHLPSPADPGAGDLLLAGLGFGLVVAGIFAGGRARFAALWFGAAILPVSGLFMKMNIPTADRFLLLPSVGVLLLLGTWLARWRATVIVIACFLALTMSRSRVWTSGEALFSATRARETTPVSMWVVAHDGIREANRTGDPEAARAVLDAAEEFFRIYREEIHLPPPGKMASEIQARRAEAYLRLGRPEAALEAARAAIALDGSPPAREAASVALAALGDFEGALAQQELVVRSGYDGPDQRRRLSDLLNHRASVREAAGRSAEALRDYRRSWEVFPHPGLNRAAREGMARLDR